MTRRELINKIQFGEIGKDRVQEILTELRNNRVMIIDRNKIYEQVANELSELITE